MTTRDVYRQIKVFTNKSPEVSDDELDTPSTPKVKAKTRIAKEATKKYNSLIEKNVANFRELPTISYYILLPYCILYFPY